LFDLDSINWAEVLINTIIATVFGVGISLFFKYVIIEDINRIYKRNRSEMIRGLLSETYRIQSIMEDVFVIIERQPDFVPDQGGTLLSLTDSEKRILQFKYQQVHNIFEYMKRFNDWKLHMTDVENLAITNYANYSDGFIKFLIKRIPEYFPEYLSARKKHALDIIYSLEDFVTNEFKDAWKKVS
jgi:hypothetical protein